MADGTLPGSNWRGSALKALVWLQGVWKGRAKDGSRYEERWCEPLGNAMMGTFRLVNGETQSPQFFEFMQIAEHPRGADMYIRHFSPVFVAWEDKDAPLRFRLALLAEQEAVFENVGRDKVRRISYRLRDDELSVSLERMLDDGSVDTSEFRFERED